MPLVLCVAAGCGKDGPELAPVTGRVTLDGKPLASADVEFQPEGRLPPSVGHTDADGRFELMYKRGINGARLGQHTVRVTVSKSVVPNAPLIPPRYNKTSELRREVKDGSNEFEFDLKLGEP
jgi:hypothetical protein